MVQLSNLLPAAILAGAAVAHPGQQNMAEELFEKREFMARNPRSVRSCSNHLERRGHQAMNSARRAEWADKIRLARGIKKRDYAAYNFSHAYTGGDVDLGTDETALFSDNSSCVLQPEVTQGPYYVEGELIRHSLVEDQVGVPLYLDIQLLDTSTCEPVPAVYLDAWHCNSTGVYAGVIASGNGNSDDATNLDNTFLRGIQQTDANGIVQFETLVPGHYTGRAPHIHILAHNTNDTIVRLNDTLLGNSTSAQASHVGQIFFDQDLITQVEATEPYNTNTQDLTTNADDSILAQEADSMDPFIEYTMVSDDIADGVIGWISIGIDPTTDSEISSAAVHYASGGVMGDSSGMGGGNGTAPSGAPPSSTSAA